MINTVAIPVWPQIPQSSSAAGCPQQWESLSPWNSVASLGFHYTLYTVHVQTETKPLASKVMWAHICNNQTEQNV